MNNDPNLFSYSSCDLFRLSQYFRVSKRGTMQITLLSNSMLEQVPPVCVVFIDLFCTTSATRTPTRRREFRHAR